MGLNHKGKMKLIKQWNGKTGKNLLKNLNENPNSYANVIRL